MATIDLNDLKVRAEFGLTWPMLGKGIVRAVMGSFEGRHQMRQSTMAERTRRVQICTEGALDLRTALSWSTERICDELPALLAAKLEGRSYEPPKRETWINTIEALQ